MSQSDGNQDRNGELGRLADRELIRRFAEHRDQKAFRLLVDRHGGLVFGVCRRILRHHHDAEDAFQATFLVLARKAGRGGWHQSLANWLYGTAARIALKDGSARRRQEEHTMKAEPTVEPAAFDELARSHARRILDEELSQLPDRYRAPLVLCYLEGQTREQAAEELGCSLGTVKGRLERGRHELRLRLLRRGIGVSLPAVAGGLVLSSGGAAQASIGSVSTTVPKALAASTVKSAMGFATGASLGGAVTSQSLTLAQGELAMISSTTLVKHCATAALALIMLVMGYVLTSSDATAEQPKDMPVVETELATKLMAGELVPMVLADVGDGKDRRKTAGRTRRSSQGASQATVKDHYVIFPVHTEFQRKWLGECTAYALLNGIAAYETGRKNSKLLEQFKGDLERYASEQGAILIRTYYGRGSALYNNGTAVRQLHASLKGVAHDAGFSTVRIQSCISNEEDAGWKTQIAPLHSQDKEKGDKSESPIAVGKIRIYPVRTRLSRWLTAADVVIDIPSIPAQGKADADLRLRIATAVEELDVESKEHLRFQLPEIDPMSGLSRDQVLQEMDQLATSLGFEQATVQLGPSAWSGL